MSEIKITKTKIQRRNEARENIEFRGRKAHKANPGSLAARTQAVQVNLGILDEDGRYPDTATRSPERLRRNSIKRRVAKGVAVTALAVGGGFIAGKIAPEPSEAPNPGNMTEFQSDPLQSEYNKNPDGFTVQGGAIKPKTGAESISDIVDSGALDTLSNQQMKSSGSNIPTDPNV